MRPIRILFVLGLAFLSVTGVPGEQVLQSFEQAGQSLFPGADQYKPAEAILSAQEQKVLGPLLKPFQGRGWSIHPQTSYPLIEATAKGKPMGILVQIEEIGKHKLITFAVGVKTDGTVQGVQVLTYRENYGIHIKDETFLRQYQGKRWSDKIDTPGDIDAVSGATYSSYATNRAVRKALAVLRVLEKAGVHEKKQ